MMQCHDTCSVQYAQLSPIHITDFTPSRVTRPSSNHFLQEHCAIDGLYDKVRRTQSPSQLYCYLTQAAEGERKLKGKYVQVEFAKTYPGYRHPCVSCKVGGRREGECNCGPAAADPGPAVGGGPDPGRGKSVSDRTANGTVSPLCIRSRTERKRRAFRRREKVGTPADNSICEVAAFLTDVAREMDVESSVVMYHDPLGGANAAGLGCSGQQSRHFQPNFAHTHTHARALVRPVPFQLPTDNGVSCTARVLHHPSNAQTDRSPPLHSLASSASNDRGSETSERSCAFTHTLCEGDSGLSQERYCDELVEEQCVFSDGNDDLPDVPETHPVVIPPRHHRPLSRQMHHTLLSSSQPSESPLSKSHTSTPPSPAPLPASKSASNYHSNKPLPTPKAKSQDDIYGVYNKDTFSVTDGRALKDSSNSSPDLTASGTSLQHRPRSVSFMNISAGAELGRFPADYLGSEPIDCYSGFANSVAKSLINSRPIEVMAYVTSEKLRLAPPNNSCLLFKSFAIKDILSVQKCSKNKRIIGVLVWKSRALPVCHILRCPTHLVSSALYDSILDQTQNVDDISNEKISPSRLLSDGSDSSLSPSELLHKLPAIHIGSARAGRQDAVNDVIQRVLVGSRPTAAKEVSVWLSLAQLRLIDMSDERELIYESHETSRIRAIGVHSVDKRFIGYIVKEEGRPLVGHVLRCNSAALMVSLVSFLRQACQIMFSQQGGSLYDELSSDESDGETEETHAPSHGLIQRLRSITNVTSQPTFVSHTPLHHSPPLPNSHPSHHRPAGKCVSSSAVSANTTILSPLEFPEEDFALFSVTYIGSAIVELPFSPASVTRAQTLFQEKGVAGGRAAVAKNVIQMHISVLGITLIDKKHRLFVHRNYPRNQLAGYCRDSENERVFAFGSRRPGYPSEIKCHVFRQVQETSDHILQALKHWLEQDPPPA